MVKPSVLVTRRWPAAVEATIVETDVVGPPVLERPAIKGVEKCARRSRVGDRYFDVVDPLLVSHV